MLKQGPSDLQKNNCNLQKHSAISSVNTSNRSPNKRRGHLSTSEFHTQALAALGDLMTRVHLQNIRTYQHLWVRSNSVYRFWRQLLSSLSRPSVSPSLPPCISAFSGTTSPLIKLHQYSKCSLTFLYPYVPKLVCVCVCEFKCVCSFNAVCSLQHAVRFYTY